MEKSEGKRRGRPPKKTYDEKAQFQELLDKVDYCYEVNGEIKATALELEMNPIRVKKLLITSGKLVYEETAQIQRLLAYGRSMQEIQETMNLKKSSINSYLPYSKIPYKANEISANADRCDLYRKRKLAVDNISGPESLWEAILLFQNYPFKTNSGSSFKYELKPDSEGNPSKELLIRQKDESLSITLATVVEAYEKSTRIKATVIESPQALGNWEGILYIYWIFYRFGLIKVPQN